MPQFAGSSAGVMRSYHQQWETRFGGRSLGGLFIAAGIVALVTLSTGVDELVQRSAIRALACLAIAFGIAVVLAAVHLPERGFAAGLALGVVLVSSAVVGSAEADTPYAMFYVWIGAEAWYFLRPRAATVLSALTLLASAVAMTFAVQSDDDTFAWWLLISTTLIVVAVLAAVLRMRSERLIDSLSDAASRDTTRLASRRSAASFGLGLEADRSPW